MTVRTPSRRRTPRYAVGADGTARVEFEYPTPGGRRYGLPLINISKAGISFALDDHDELAQLDPGTMIPNVVVQVGECRIEGEIMLMHLTPDVRSRAMCGALFYPASDTDLLKLRSLIAGMEALASN